MRGFSLLEMAIVTAIGMILTAISFVSLQPMLKQARADAAYDMTLMMMRNYRSRAITERKRYIVTFAPPRTITVQSWGIGFPIAPAPVQVATLTLPTDVQFMVQAGLPSTPTTVPDGFGNGSTAIDFGQLLVREGPRVLRKERFARYQVLKRELAITGGRHRVGHACGVVYSLYISLELVNGFGLFGNDMGLVSLLAQESTGRNQ